MSAFSLCWRVVKMFYQIFCFSASLLAFFFNVFWFLCNLASAGIPWCTLVLVVVCVASKFVKLKGPKEKLLLNLLGGNATPDDLSYWPIANRGAGYDAPENSRAAIKKCSIRGFRNVLLDVGLSSCGEIVLVNRATIEKAGLCGGASKHSLETLKTINIADLHPLGSHFGAETILTLDELLKIMQQNELTIFLHAYDSSRRMLEKLKATLLKHEILLRRTILISHSPYIIYQLRKICPDLICGLWTEKSLSLPMLKASTLITSIYGAIFRNIIAPVIGISVVFVSKEEFNVHIAELWRNVGVRPIVYKVNSPNEKRYFQKTIKTQYLTDSLRSEPHLLMKA